MTGTSLQGARILVIEDDMLVYLLLEDMLTEFGCEIVGPATRLTEAVDLASAEECDCALLDINIAGKPAYPAAEKLAERGIPFAFVTGYAIGDIAKPYRQRPTVQKPFDDTELAQVLKDMLRHAAH